MKTKDPVFIIGVYRGGTSLLFRLLSESEELWSLYRESNQLWRRFSRHPQELSDTIDFIKNDKANFVNRVTGEELKDLEALRKYCDDFYDEYTYNSYFWGYLGRVRLLRDKLSPLFWLINKFNWLSKKLLVSEYRFVDKTPPNVYRVELLRALYPNAKFIYLVRNEQANVKSLVDAWCHKSKFSFAYRSYLTQDLNIQGYDGKVWKFYIPPNLKEFEGKTIQEVCTWQYRDAHQRASQALAVLPREQVMQVSFEDLLEDPACFMQSICDFVSIDYSAKIQKIVRAMPATNTDKKFNRV